MDLYDVEPSHRALPKCTHLGMTGHFVGGSCRIGLTMNTYAHVLPEIERAAVDEAAKHLFG